MGAGDEIPAVLEQIGMDVTLIPAEKLGSERSSRYQTIALGIRAYDTQKDVIANNKRLLDFVQSGGRLLVQYNTLSAASGDFNSGKFTPYPATFAGHGFRWRRLRLRFSSGEPDFSFSE